MYSHLAMHTMYLINVEVMLYTLGSVVKVELHEAKFPHDYIISKSA